jgi:hypothetical protein
MGADGTVPYIFFFGTEILHFGPEIQKYPCDKHGDDRAEKIDQ